ncbi:unnamed protein product [Urochloa decumbens]|uniref:Uncharacterized protein n=1 Tax=Urochloa decumbens TaxID=240449 RepID=A0ABC8ZL48_9POAL
MPPGRKKGQTKAHTTEEPHTEIERERAKAMMRNNQMLQSLSLTALASIVNKSIAKTKSMARENSGSLYELEDMEDIEHGVVDKVSHNTIMSTGGTRGSKRIIPPGVQDQPARITRQRIRELSSTEEGLNGKSPNTQEDALIAAHCSTQADDEIHMCNEGEPNVVRDGSNRGRSMDKHLGGLSRGLNAKIPVVIAEGKRRPEAPIEAAKLASESGIIVRQHVPIYTHWKEYKKDEATCKDYMGKIADRFSMDINNQAVKYACTDLLRCRQRNMRHHLKKAFFDGVPANQVTTTSPVDTMTDEQWQALVDMWSSPKHKEKCAKAKLSRENVRYPQKTGSRCFIAHAHVAKQEKYKDAPPTAIDIFKDTHCSSKTGLSEPVRQAIAQMEAIIAEPAEGQLQKTPVEAVAQVLISSSFLQNVGLEQATPKRSAKSAAAAAAAAASAAARVEELEAEVEAEKQGSAVHGDKVDSQQDELETLKKFEESEEAREKQSEEIENLKKQAEENRKHSVETNALLRRLFSLDK